jgi:hypothetical protein
VFVYDLQSGETRATGPASSIPIIFHGSVIAYYEESELHWSTDSTWLVWDLVATPPDGLQLYAHAVATGATQLVAANASFFRGEQAYSPGKEVYPWLPQGNLLEYSAGADSALVTDSILTVDDLDGGRPVFVAPFPIGEITVTNATSGKSTVVAPMGICARLWLRNDQLLWHGCDSNAYLSRIVGGALAETRLLATGVGSFFALTGNRQLVVMPPADYIGNWQMYDLLAGRLVELQSTAGMYCCDGSLLL